MTLSQLLSTQSTRSTLRATVHPHLLLNGGAPARVIAIRGPGQSGSRNRCRWTFLTPGVSSDSFMWTPAGPVTGACHLTGPPEEAEGRSGRGLQGRVDQAGRDGAGRPQPGVGRGRTRRAHSLPGWNQVRPTERGGAAEVTPGVGRDPAGPCLAHSCPPCTTRVPPRPGLALPQARPSPGPLSPPGSSPTRATAAEVLRAAAPFPESPSPRRGHEGGRGKCTFQGLPD